MSKLDQDRENLIRLIISICNYARLGYEVSTQNNCNNCKEEECKYRPYWGNSVRWNCPLWKGEPDEID